MKCFDIVSCETGRASGLYKKTYASKPLGMVVNESGLKYHVGTKCLACPVRMLRIRMTDD